MPAFLFLLYVVVEFLAFVWAVNTIGAVWAVLLLIASSLVGSVLVRWQWRTVAAGFRRAQRGEASPGGAIADGALVGLGGVLMFVPGLVTSAIGLLLLIPPTRWVVKPLVVALGTRVFGPITVVTGPTQGAVIDGEVVDDQIVTQPALPTAESGRRDPEF